MKRIRMFCGELDGELQPLHISFRAENVRVSIRILFRHEVAGFDQYNAAALWKAARKAGWRVVSVYVELCR